MCVGGEWFFNEIIFNGISTNQLLFFALRLRNRYHCTLLFTFVRFLKRFFQPRNQVFISNRNNFKHISLIHRRLAHRYDYSGWQCSWKQVQWENDWNRKQAFYREEILLLWRRYIIMSRWQHTILCVCLTIYPYYSPLLSGLLVCMSIQIDLS